MKKHLNKHNLTIVLLAIVLLVQMTSCTKFEKGLNVVDKSLDLVIAVDEMTDDTVEPEGERGENEE